jgi:large subunit ribosomal protein LP1
MATVPVNKLPPNEVAELACTYAALILHDEDIEINGTPVLIPGNKIASLVSAAGVNIDAFWPKLFAKALEGRNVADFFSVGGDSAGAAPAAAETVAPAKEKEAAKKDDSNRFCEIRKRCQEASRETSREASRRRSGRRNGRLVRLLKHI